MFWLYNQNPLAGIYFWKMHSATSKLILISRSNNVLLQFQEAVLPKWFLDKLARLRRWSEAGSSRADDLARTTKGGTGGPKANSPKTLASTHTVIEMQPIKNGLGVNKFPSLTMCSLQTASVTPMPTTSEGSDPDIPNPSPSLKAPAGAPEAACNNDRRALEPRRFY